MRATLPGDVIIVPEGFFAGDWRGEVSLALAPTFTDNYRLAPSGKEDSALLITLLTPKIEVAGSGFAGALSAALRGQYVAERDFSAVPEIVQTGKAELSRDTVYVDAATGVQMLPLNATTPISSVAIDTRDLAPVQSYRLSPYAVTRLKDFALAELRYTLGVTNGLGVQLASPREQRSRFGWQARASGEQTTRFGTGDVRTGGLTASPQYALSGSLSLLTVAGYSFLGPVTRT